MAPAIRRRKTGRSAKVTLKKVNAKVNKLASQSETKHVDVLLTGTEVNFDANKTQALCIVAQGDAHNERIGDSMSPFRLNMKLAISNISADSAPQFVRLTVIQSKQRFTPNTIATSGVTQLYSTADVDEVVVSNLVHDNRSHYVLLHDKTYPISPDGNRGMIITLSKKISRKIEFEPGSTTTEAGQLWFCLTSDIAAASTGPTFKMASRVLYKDS